MTLRIRTRSQRRRGAALVEYGLIVAGVALVSAAALAVFGHKTSDLIGASATVIPGSHADDNGPIISGKLIETQQDATTNGISVDVAGIQANSGNDRLGGNLLGTASGYDATTTDGFGGLILEAN